MNIQVTMHSLIKNRATDAWHLQCSHFSCTFLCSLSDAIWTNKIYVRSLLQFLQFLIERKYVISLFLEESWILWKVLWYREFWQSAGIRWTNVEMWHFISFKQNVLKAELSKIVFRCFYALNMNQKVFALIAFN